MNHNTPFTPEQLAAEHRAEVGSQLPSIPTEQLMRRIAFLDEPFRSTLRGYLGGASTEMLARQFNQGRLTSGNDIRQYDVKFIISEALRRVNDPDRSAQIEKKRSDNEAKKRAYNAMRHQRSAQASGDMLQ